MAPPSRSTAWDRGRVRGPAASAGRPPRSDGGAPLSGPGPRGRVGGGGAPARRLAPLFPAATRQLRSPAAGSRAPGGCPLAPGVSPRPPRGTQTPFPHPPAPTEPLCFLAAPMWKWPGSEPPLTRVSKLPGFLTLAGLPSQRLCRPRGLGPGGRGRGAGVCRACLCSGLWAFASPWIAPRALGLAASVWKLVGLTGCPRCTPAPTAPPCTAGLVRPRSSASVSLYGALRPQSG